MQGLDKIIIEQIDYNLALRRIRKDILSDFVISPHYQYIYEKFGEELWDYLKTSLNSGKYCPRLPIFINVPKATSLIRRGAILEPLDRLIYQSLADLMAPKIEESLEREIVYSNILVDNDNDGYMFEPSREGYKNFKEAIKNHCESKKYKYVLRTDIASYFDTIYQHVLINSLRSLDCESGAVNLLEDILLYFRERNSHGIIQGLFPSDLFGNYYLCNIDNQFLIDQTTSIRYVDDMYIFLSSRFECLRVLDDLCTRLMKDGLFLNENKTKIDTVEETHFEETELDRMFEKISGEFKDIKVIYGMEFLEDEQDYSINGEDIELSKVEELYLKHKEAKWQRDHIIRFCLPKLSLGYSNIAVSDAFKYIIEYPHLTRDYCIYLAKLSKVLPDLNKRIIDLIMSDNLVYDFQYMWLYYCLMFFKNINRSVLNYAIGHLQNKNSSEALRSITTSLISKNGNSSQRKILFNEYSNEPSEYVKSSILYSTRFLTSGESHSYRKAWGSHSFYNSLLAKNR